MKAECYSCGFETELTEYSRRSIKAQKKKMKLCAICASTTAGIAFDYPDQYPERDTLHMVAYVANLILATLKKSQESEG